jgi:transposase
MTINIDLESLPTDVVALQKMIVELVATIKNLTDKLLTFTKLTEEIEFLREQLALSKKERFGKTSEKIQKLGDLEEFQAEEIESSTKSKTKPKRQKLPDNLPREDVIYSPPSVCPECGGDNFRKIDDDISEQLERIIEAWQVVRHIRPRCACNNCDHITQAEMASSPIYRGIAGPGLLSYVIIQKYCNHLPLYRQSQIYKREGIELSRSTMADWMYQSSELLKPVINKLKEYVFSANHLHGDDTPVKVLAPGTGKTKVGRIWTYVLDGRAHGASSFPAVCYYYSPDRKGERPLEHLRGFSGILHTDAYSGYNGVYANGVTKAGCWAHVRRKFYEITVVSDNAKIAYNTLELIQQLYKVEQEIRGQNPQTRFEQRQVRSREIVEIIFTSFEKTINDLPKQSATAKAINYALNNKKSLMEFLTDGKIEIDNNIAERAVRSIAVGRKNWLFAGSDGGGDIAAAFYSLIETAKLNDINPEEYLRYVLTVIQDYNAQKLAELLPWNIKLH